MAVLVRPHSLHKPCNAMQASGKIRAIHYYILFNHLNLSRTSALAIACDGVAESCVLI